jgi:RNA polymerase-binding transcription factor DksA
MFDIKLLHNQLVRERQRLTDELAEVSRARVENDQREGSPFGKREEDATEVFELGKKLAIENQVRNNLAMIEHALKKYDSGTYGLCDVCGKAIEPARLEALPYASQCLTCNAKQKKNG